MIADRVGHRATRSSGLALVPLARGRAARCRCPHARHRSVARRSRRRDPRAGDATADSRCGTIVPRSPHDVPLRPPHLAQLSFGPGPMTPAVKWIIIVNVGAVRRRRSSAATHRSYLRADPRAGDRASLDLAARHVHVPARRLHAHPLQHARASGCSASSSSGCGARSFFLRYYAVTGIGAALTMLARRRCCRSQSAVRPTCAHRRRLGRALRPAARVCALLPRAADPDVPPLSRAGASISS